MIQQAFEILERIDAFYWGYIGFTIVTLAGLYFTLKSKFFQLKAFFQFRHTMHGLSIQEGCHGTHPFKLYFASIGGSVGLGNIVGVTSAIALGGPGALFWLWLAFILGMLIKYAEIYLSVKHRVRNDHGFDGGPVFYLREAFGKWAGLAAGILLCIYGVEVYQFKVVSDTLLDVFPSVNHTVMVLILLVMVLYVGLGGINRLAHITTVMMPIFLCSYVFMALWVVFQNFDMLPGLLKTVFESAFNGHAAVGGFAGSTIIQAAQYGTAKAVYSGDIGVGYDATIQCETRTRHPEYQARLSIYSLFTNAVICTLSILVVLISNIWQNNDGLLHSEYVEHALSAYFPMMHIFMPLLLFFAGYTTIIAFFTVGMKTARMMFDKKGAIFYFCYAVFAFIFFSYFDQSKVVLIMSLSGGLLVLLNVAAIIRFRHDIAFK